MKKKRIGDVLLERGSVAEEDLNRALAIHHEKNVRLGEALLQTVQIPNIRFCGSLIAMISESSFTSSGNAQHRIARLYGTSANTSGAIDAGGQST